MDINNVGNLINSNWGVPKQLSSDRILVVEGDKYTFSQPSWRPYKNTFSTWNMLITARYSF